MSAIQPETLTVENVDVGINSTLPSNKVGWATGRNVRFTPGYVSKTLGKNVLGTLAGTPTKILAAWAFMGFDGNIYNIICTASKVYSANTNFITFTDITPTVAPTGGESDFWDFTIVCGLPVLTNGKDNMWKWVSPSAILVPMTHGVIAKNISCSMHRLVCSNIIENSMTYTGRVRWSESGNPENMAIDTTKKSGRYDLMNYQDGKDSQHDIVAQVSNGSKVYFFTKRNVWISDFAEAIKPFVILDSDFELISKRSVVMHHEKIYAADSRDIYTFHNGKQSIGLPIKKELYASLNMAKRTISFAFPMFATNEIWFCVPTGTNTDPDTAYVYNWELSVWSICDCDFLCHSIFYGTSYNSWVNDNGEPVGWANNSGSIVGWENNTLSELGVIYPFAKDTVGDSASHILSMDDGFNALSTSLAVTAINGSIETGDMVLGSRGFEKIIEKIFPDLASQTQNNSLMIQVGVRESLAHTIQWSPAVAFQIGVDSSADLRNYLSQGVYIRLRFCTNELSSPWSLSNYYFEYTQGRRTR